MHSYGAAASVVTASVPATIVGAATESALEAGQEPLNGHQRSVVNMPLEHRAAIVHELPAHNPYLPLGPLHLRGTAIRHFACDGCI